MNPTKNFNIIKIVFYIIYGLMVVLTILVIYLVINNWRIVQSVSSTLIKTHSVELNLEKFNKILEQIKNQ